jgi:eight-cysteine-cluster-containing protein
MKKVIAFSIFLAGVLLILISFLGYSFLFKTQSPPTQKIQGQHNNSQDNKTIECAGDMDCGVGGCSGEICTTAERAKGMVTACVWKPDFECLKKTACKCMEGKCGWEENQAYRECVGLG